MAAKKICYSDICDSYYLKKGFMMLKSNITWGVGDLFKGTSASRKWVKLFNSLRVQAYQPKCRKKVSVFQVGKEVWCRGLIPLMDKVVQRRILELLTYVVESLFYEQSFGFRHSKGSHDALKYVKSYWSNLNWIIRVSIEKHFVRINYKILLTKMYYYMDQPSLNLVGKFCEIGYIKCDYLAESFQTFEQISYGFILFPLLCNIYLHGFDAFILKKLTGMYATEDTRVTVLGCQVKKSVSLGNLKFWQLFCKFKQNEESATEKVFLGNFFFWKATFYSSFNQLNYVRYTVHFMLGGKGGRLELGKVSDKIFHYVSDNLKLILYPDEVNAVYSIKFVRYLETLICWDKPLKRKNSKVFDLFKSNRITLLDRPRVMVSLENLLMGRALKKYWVRRFMYSTIARAISFSSIIEQDLYCIVKSFNDVIRDIVKYYSFVSCRSQLWKIVDVYRQSCAAAIANKLKLKTVALVFQKFGRFLFLKDNLGKRVAYLDAWPHNLQTKKKFNIKDFKTSFSSLVTKVNNYLLYF